MKKILALALSLAMLLSFAACDDDMTEKKKENEQDNISSADVNKASDVLQKYYDAQVNFDVDTYIELMPEYYSEKYVQKGLKAKVEVERYLRDIQDYFNTVFGKNTSIEVEVTLSEELMQDELDDATNEYKNVGLEDFVIEKGVKLNYNVTKTGEKFTRSVTATAVVIVENGVWKVMDILES